MLLIVHLKKAAFPAKTPGPGGNLGMCRLVSCVGLTMHTSGTNKTQLDVILLLSRIQSSE